MIEVKNLEVLESLILHPAHPKLIELLKWFSTRYSRTVITGMYEDRNYSSVHSVIPVRGIDIRSSVFEKPKKVADDVNAHWCYDHTRPQFKCAVYHNAGRGFHLHLQVHPRTMYLG